MKVIAGKRQTGKTTKLIHMCAEKEAAHECSYIVCANQQRAYNIVQMAKALGYESFPFPITYDELLHTNLSQGFIVHLFVDDAEELVRRIYTGVPMIAAITVNADEILEQKESPAGE